MDVLEEELSTISKQGRQASATVEGKRYSGYLLGNRFIFNDQDADVWSECGPGQFKDLKIWRK